MKRFIDEPRNTHKQSFLVIAAMFALCIVLLPGGNNARADWRTPVMSDYIKSPLFISQTAKPNIMIILDNSGSMNFNAYGTWPGDNGTVSDSPFDGEPYKTTGGLQSFRVISGADDVEEQISSSTTYNYSGDLDLGGFSVSLNDSVVGIRFQDVAIPQGATITTAYIEFTADKPNSETTNLLIEGEASDDATPFSGTTNNVKNRTSTAATVSWNNVEAWTAGVAYKSPSLTTIVQEVVDRSGWASGNAMVFRFTSVGTTGNKRDIQSYDTSASTAPVLRVEYEDNEHTRYYGYFNPDYFYTYSNKFDLAYRKVSYNTSTALWNVKTLSGSATTLSNSDIVTKKLWDGNWLNWMCMRRIDILRKVLMGGLATARTGGGNQVNYGENPAQSGRNFVKEFDTSGVGPAVSPYDGNYAFRISGGNIYIDNDHDGNFESSEDKYYIRIQKNINYEPEDFYEDNLAGVLQRVGSRARWGNIWFNDGNGSGESGGTVAHTMGTNMTTMITDLQNTGADTWTPLAESLYVATQYFAQEDPAGGLDYPNNAVPNANIGDDPYYDSDLKEAIPCAKSFVLLLTDGASTKDAKIPSGLKDVDADGDNTSCNEDTESNCDYPTGGTDFLDDVALYARTTDLRSATKGKDELDGDQNLILYAVYAFGDDENARSLIKDAARNGGFDDQNGNDKPDGDYSSPPEDRLEWDRDSDGMPDTYFEASDGYALQSQLLAAINAILERASSGTAASVISNSRSGEGAIYQSIFYPAKTIKNNTVNWIGQVHSLMVDAYGNMREDTLHNAKLDLAEDMFIVFDGSTAYKFKDDNADGRFDYSERYNSSGVLSPDETGKLEDIIYTWNSNDWLNKLDDATDQRAYNSSDKKRYIFTFVDADRDMVADSGEVMDFEATTTPTWADMTDLSKFYAYMYTYDPFTPPIPVTDSDFRPMVERQAQRLVNFIRGQDQAFEMVGSVILPSSRSRQIDYDNDGTVETWRLGDIVHSTPKLVQMPAEKYDLLYRDDAYSTFYLRHRYRRNVIYAGSNDGMLHAFNGGFYNPKTKGFEKEMVDKDGNPYTNVAYPSTFPFELGAELWAYVPFNLLAHLHWLEDFNYSHIYYNDIEPKIFEAKVYDETKADPDIYPNGYATLLVGGMRFGGGKIASDLDKEDGAYNPNVDIAMSSAYYILDITNPEAPPKVLGEFTFPDLGFTTCYPAVMTVRNKIANNPAFMKDNEWYLVFGSGPASEDGLGADGANTDALLEGTSTQQAVMYAIDLVKLAQDGELWTITNSGKKKYSPSDAGPYYLTQLPEANSSVSQPVTVDWGNDWNTDAVYFGESFTNSTGNWGGKLRRLVVQPDESTNALDPATWELDSVLMDLSSNTQTTVGNGQPIQTAVSVTVDAFENGNRWIYFGTGRYYSATDAANTDQQSYYGIKEPYDEKSATDETKIFNWKQVTPRNTNLVDVTNVKVYDNGANVTGLSGVSNYDELVAKIGDNQGWLRDLVHWPNTERNLGRAALIGKLLTFTTFKPSDNPCIVAGETNLYALYFLTGTAYIESVLGTTTSGDPIKDTMDLGPGLSETPNIHVGRSTGSTAFIQTSTGEIKELEEKNPGQTKTGKVSWKEDNKACAP